MVFPDEELKQIDRVTEALYASISFEEDGAPALGALKRLFITEGKLINNNDDVPVIMTVDQFIKAFQMQLSSGAVSSFHETEVASRTEIFGKIAHRFSTYEAKFDLDAPDPFCIGINSLQFIKVDQSWLVASLVWNDQSEELRIPSKYFPSPERG